MSKVSTAPPFKHCHTTDSRSPCPSWLIQGWTDENPFRSEISRAEEQELQIPRHLSISGDGYLVGMDGPRSAGRPEHSNLSNSWQIELDALGAARGSFPLQAGAEYVS